MQEKTMLNAYCPTCGVRVQVLSTNEGTCCYQPLDPTGLLKENTRLRRALQTIFRDSKSQAEAINLAYEALQ